MNFLASYWPLLAIVSVFLFMHRSGRGCGTRGAGHQHGKEPDHHATDDHEPTSRSLAPKDAAIRTSPTTPRTSGVTHHS